MSENRKIPPIVWAILFLLMLTIAVAYGKSLDRWFIIAGLLGRLIVAVVVEGLFWKYWQNRDSGG